MSGTSMDAVDAAIIQTDGERIYDFGPAIERPYTSAERAVLQAATDAARAWNWQGEAPHEVFAAAHRTILDTHVDAWQRLNAAWVSEYAEAGLIQLIGVHGQTVLHRRPQTEQVGATLQLLDGQRLARRIGCAVAYDFRSADIAAGGQGAPLAPAYHAALLRNQTGSSAAILNLGGVANITARMPDDSLIAFDTGPANGPLDEWVEGHNAGTHDAGGRLAARGRVHVGVLNQLLDHAYFSEQPPKSLDRYDFNASMVRGLSLQDGAATLTAFTAQSVASGLQHLPHMPDRMIVCGGGRHNPVMMQRLAEVLPCPVFSAERAGWRGDSIEAEAFAFLAVRSLRGLALSWPGTTGVPGAMTGGKISYATI